MSAEECFRIIRQAPGDDPVEWERIVDGKRIPLTSLEEANRRLRKCRLAHPDWVWRLERLQ
jgi:hypothetical protein